MPKFMLILHSAPHGLDKASPEEIQKIIEKFESWKEKLAAADRLVSSDKLKEEGGKVITVKNGQMSVVDGPYSEAKEVVAGYFMFRAANYDEAVEMTRDCPALQFGRIEIRQTDPMGCGGE